MKPKSLALTLAGCAVLAAAALFPVESSGQANAEEEAQVQQALAEITAQQTILTENQAKIDEKVGLVAEEIRIARIFAGRAGKK
jgi:hypothetical protein